jgi:hypothetical protein
MLSNVTNLHVTPHLDGVFCSNFELDQAFTNVFFNASHLMCAESLIAANGTPIWLDGENMV